MPSGCAWFRPADEHAGEAAEPVVEGHHFRHGGHGNGVGGHHADGGADEDADENPGEGQAAREEGGGDGEQHADGGDCIAGARALRAAQHFQPVDEQDGRCDVAGLDEGRVGELHFLGSFFLNIASMRSVTR